jgi:hypothetical protein
VGNCVEVRAVGRLLGGQQSLGHSLRRERVVDRELSQ